MRSNYYGVFGHLDELLRSALCIGDDGHDQNGRMKLLYSFSRYFEFGVVESYVLASRHFDHDILSLRLYFRVEWYHNLLSCASTALVSVFIPLSPTNIDPQ